MSKKIIGFGLAIAAVAIPFVGPVIGGAIAGFLGVSAGIATAIAVAGLSVGLALTQSILLGPAVPKQLNTNPVDRLYATLDTTTPRKIAFGNTAFATDIRYQAYTGASQDKYEQIHAMASHTVYSLDEIWLDNEKAWTNGGGTQGRFVDYFSADINTAGGAGHPGMTVDSVWDGEATLTYCASAHIRFTLIGPDADTPSVFQGGVTSRITFRGRGMPLYDPRLDSTVVGGSGSQRAGTQSTWLWTDVTGRNPALQLLAYLLGWRGNNKLMVGMGMPAARIDLPSFITAANICEENVSVSGGGTQKRYCGDGLLSEGDDRQAVIDTLCSTMNATLRDSGGKIALEVIRDDTGSPVCDFTLDDILGGEEWVQTPPLNQYFNIVRGRYVDASDNALYQLSEYPAVSIASPDGIDRIQTVDFPFVQSASQAQRLAKLRLQRNQHQGRYSATFGSRAWQVNVGNIVRLTHAGLTFFQKKFRVAEQRISRTGETMMTLIEENAAGYVWDVGEEVVPPVVPTPPKADPTLNPIFLRLSIGRQRFIGSSTPRATTTGVGANVGFTGSTGVASSTATATAEGLKRALSVGDSTTTAASVGVSSSGAAISFVGSSRPPETATNGAGVTLTFASVIEDTAGGTPAIVQGDLVVCVFAIGAAANRDLASYVISPGWNVASEIYGNGSVTDINLCLLWKFMGAVPDTNIHVNGSGNSSDSLVLTAHVFRGVNQSIPFDTANTTATSVGTSNPNPPAITPSTPGAWIFVAGAGGCALGTAADYLVPGDLSATTGHFRRNYVDDTRSTIAGAGIKTDWVSGAFNPAAWTGSSAAVGDSWAAITAVLKPQ